MNEYINKFGKVSKFAIILGVVTLVAILVIAYLFYSLSRNIKTLSSTTETLSQRVAFLEAGLATTTLTSQELSQRLSAQQNQNNSLESTVNNIAGTVGTLTKLSQTDKELLQKYSLVYFLSDNYVPMSLQSISQKYLHDQTKTLLFHTLALSFLENMLERASRDSVFIQVVSAYRSFGTQSSLKSSYLVTYGTGSNQFSADQGYSEHQLGTAVDLMTEGDASPLQISFENTAGFKWLANNAYRYGFVLSYPKNNAYYQYEPWHWRFVGVALATKLHNDGTNFSDMDQREIDTYLANIFD